MTFLWVTIAAKVKRCQLSGPPVGGRQHGAVRRRGRRRHRRRRTRGNVGSHQAQAVGQRGKHIYCLMMSFSHLPIYTLSF